MKNPLRFSLSVLVPWCLAFGIAACGSSGSTPPADVPSDVPAEAIGDAGSDSTVDLAIDTPAEGATDLPAESAGDTPIDPSGDPVADLPPDTNPDLPVVPDKVQVRFLNLLPQLRDLDLFVNQATPALVSGLGFAEGTAYQVLEPGSTRFDVAPAGDGLAGSLANSPDFPLTAGMILTLFTYDLDGDVKFGGFPDDYGDIPDGQVRIRVAHVASGVRALDLFLVPDGGSPVPMGTFGQGQPSESTVDLPAGRFQLAVDINSDSMPDWTFTTPAISAGNVLNLFLVKADGEMFVLAQANNNLFRVPQDAVPPGKAHVRALNLASDRVGVQVSANDASPALFQDLAFETDSGWKDLDPGSYTFTFASADPGAVQYLVSNRWDLADRRSYTVVGFDDSTRLKAVLAEEDDTFLGNGAYRFRLIHAAPDVGAVDVWGNPGQGGFGGLQIQTGLTFGTVGAYQDSSMVPLVLGLDTNGDQVSETLFTVPRLLPGAVVNLFLMQSQGTPYLVLQEPDGTLTRIPKDRDPARTRVRVMNLADSGTMDLYADGIGPVLQEGIEVGQGSAYVDVVPGAHSFVLADAGRDLPDGMMVEFASFEYTAGTDHTLLAYANRPALQALVLDDSPLMVPFGQYQLRLVHAAWGVDALQVYEGDGEGFFVPRVGAQYGDAPAWDRAVEAFPLGFGTPGLSAPETVFQIPAVAPGSALNVYVTAAGGVTWLVAQFPDGTTKRIDADL